MVIPTDEAAKVACTYQFFYFILECFAFFRSVTMVVVVAAIFGHVGVGRCGCLSSRMRERTTVRGAYLVKRGWRGSHGRVSGRGLGCGVGLEVVAA